MATTLDTIGSSAVASWTRPEFKSEIPPRWDLYESKQGLWTRASRSAEWAEEETSGRRLFFEYVLTGERAESGLRTGDYDLVVELGSSSATPAVVVVRVPEDDLSPEAQRICYGLMYPSPLPGCPVPVDVGGNSLAGRKATFEFTEQFLTRLLDAPSPLQNSLFDALLRDSEPRAIWRVGLRLFRETFQERYLLLVRSLLEAFGTVAWPVLRQLASSGRSECDLFVGLISHCRGVRESARVAAIMKLAKNPEAEVRSQILEVLTAFSQKAQRLILKTLSKDADENIRDAAQERLLALA